MQARRRNQLRPYRVALAGGVAVGLLAAFIFIPFPQRITAPVVIESRGASRVYVTAPGTSWKPCRPVRLSAAAKLSPAWKARSCAAIWLG